ncbi:hypothetical protein CMK11_17240 [Candidatus Poribacteria bacterium]|nr:hypothetical protein [Candidatus Poribacteria bacterium]
MQVTVRCSGQLRAALETSSLGLDLPAGTTVAEAIAAMADDHGARIRSMLLDDSGAVQRTLVVAVGSAQVTDPTAHSLADGDTLTVLHPISGG